MASATNSVPNIGQTSLTNSILQNYGGTDNNCLQPLRSNADDENNEPNLYDSSFYYDTDLLKQILDTKKETFNILSLNCQSINAKFDQLKLLLRMLGQDDNSFDAICLQESWLSDNSNTNLLQIDGYHLISQGK